MLFAELEMPLLPPTASEYAQQYDYLFWFITAVITVAGLGVYTALAWFSWKYMKRDGRKPIRLLGSHKLELIWSVIPLLLFLTMYAWSTFVFNQSTQIPDDAEEVFVVGKQWMWKIQHSNGVREINELHIPVDKAVKVTGISEDVIHDFGIPAFRNKFDVVPGRYFSTWYKPTIIGEYHIFCDQYCGQGHSMMVGKAYVMKQDDYQSWLEGQTKAQGRSSADGSPAWRGRQLFLKLNCINCHNANDPDPTSAAKGPLAPNLENLYKQKVAVDNGSVITADHNYLYNSIRDPMKNVHDGWKPIMPPYGPGRVSEEEMIDLLAYIKSLKPGDLPRRTDAFPAPVGSAPPAAPASMGGNP